MLVLAQPVAVSLTVSLRVMPPASACSAAMVPSHFSSAVDPHVMQAT